MTTVHSGHIWNKQHCLEFAPFFTSGHVDFFEKVLFADENLLCSKNSQLVV